MTTLTAVSLPISLCRDLTLTGGSAHGLRMLLVAEHHRPDGASDVTVPLRALLAATGSDAVSLPDGVRNVLEVRCMPPLGDDGLPVGGGFPACVDEEDEPADEAPVCDGGDDRNFDDEEDGDEDDGGAHVAAPAAPIIPAKGADRGTYVVARVKRQGGTPPVPGRMHVAMSDGWVEHVSGPRVEVPMVELRALRTRCGMVMRLRAAALLADRRSATVRLTTAEWSLYTTHDAVISPAAVVRGYLEPGVEDLGRACPSVSVDLQERRRKGMVTGVALTFRRERPRVASSKASKAKAPKVRADA
ncbi:hypothetical protein [Lichenibacterium dinghuense]|uniref:hypothetical protein n=1 Tax=Lichenibacterium dinghuense TaxID=2895977 RepID=UPI001F1FC20A|nr:hypothetical protein [Lichenibacterium sp. 6Y81]